MAKLQWYLTRYARLSNGEFELLTYDEMPSLEIAQHRARIQLPYEEFYEVECKVGSLLKPQPQPCWINRERYSHKPHVVAIQINAEVKAQAILKMLEANDFDAKQVFADIQALRSILTKPQYQILLNTFISKPCIIKILYERGTH